MQKEKEARAGLLICFDDNHGTVIFQHKWLSKSEFDKEGQTYETLWNAKARDR